MYRMYPPSVYSQIESRSFLPREFSSDPRLVPAAAAAHFGFMNPSAVVGGTGGVHLSSTLGPFRSLEQVAAAAASGTNASLINAAYFYSQLSTPSGYDPGRAANAVPYFDDRYSTSYFPADSSAFAPPASHRRFSILSQPPPQSTSLDFSEVVAGSGSTVQGGILSLNAIDGLSQRAENKIELLLDRNSARDYDGRALAASLSGVDLAKDRTVNTGVGAGNRRKGDSSPDYVSSRSCGERDSPAAKSDPDDELLEVDIADKHVPSGGGRDDAVPVVSSTDVSSLTCFSNCFIKGTSVRLANGKVKRVEDLVAEDFVRSGFASQQFCVKNCSLLKITQRPQGRVLLHLLVDGLRSQALLEVSVERPFFVLKRGWSSCSPQRTKSVYGLTCRRLQVGDVCMYVTKVTRREKRTKTISSAMNVNSALAATKIDGISGGDKNQREKKVSFSSSTNPPSPGPCSTTMLALGPKENEVPVIAMDPLYRQTASSIAAAELHDARTVRSALTNVCSEDSGDNEEISVVDDPPETAPLERMSPSGQKKRRRWSVF